METCNVFPPIPPFSFHFSHCLTYSFNSQGEKIKLDVRELAIQFGCVRIISFVCNGLNLYKDRFLSSLPASRRSSADFTRPVFTAVAFYLCAKNREVFASMKDLCHDVFGIAKAKKDPKKVKSNRDLPGVLPEKGDPRMTILTSCKKRKQIEKPDYEDWKSFELTSICKNRPEVPCKQAKRTHLSFLKEAPDTQELEAM